MPPVSGRRQAAARVLPILAWAPAYDRRWLLADVLAGLALWAVVVPEGTAYAQLAGLRPQAALVAAPVALVAYAVAGSARLVVVGATTASAVIVGSTLGPLAAAGSDRYAALAAVLTLLAGAFFLALGALRLGWLSQFLSSSVLTGFVFGLGLVVAADQAPKLLGIPASSGNFFQRAADVGRHLDAVNLPTAAVGAAALLVLFGAPRLARGAPAALLALGLGIGAVALLGLDGHGVAIVGSIPGGVPRPAIPAGVGWGDLGTLAPGALAVCLVAYSEHMAAARRPGPEGGADGVDADQELLALGLANAGAGILQGFVVGGGLSKSEVNEQAGARSQVSSLVAAGLALVTVVALTGVFRDLPEAVLGAVVIRAVSGLMRVGAMRRYWRLRRFDFLLAATALGGELVLDVLPGLLLAVGLSLARLIYHAARPAVVRLGRLPRTTTYADVLRHPEAITVPGVVVLRLDAELFFANATRLRDAALAAVRTSPDPVGSVVCDLEATSELDVDGLDVLADLAARLRGGGCTLHLARVRDTVLDLLRRADSPLADCVHRTVDTAVQAAHADVAATRRTHPAAYSAP